MLIVVANRTTATTVWWPVGFWGAELTHPYYELTERGVAVTIASPKGGKVELDALGDPRDTLSVCEFGRKVARLATVARAAASDPHRAAEGRA